VKVNATGLTVTSAHTGPALARAVNVWKSAGLVQYQVYARTTVYGVPSRNVPAGYRPVDGFVNVNESNACRANIPGVGPKFAGGCGNQT
jgi:hypothetical protein